LLLVLKVLEAFTGITVLCEFTEHLVMISGPDGSMCAAECGRKRLRPRQDLASHARVPEKTDRTLRTSCSTPGLADISEFRVILTQINDQRPRSAGFFVLQ
jgi:hypothetical protein